MKTLTSSFLVQIKCYSDKEWMESKIHVLIRLSQSINNLFLICIIKVQREGILLPAKQRTEDKNLRIFYRNLKMLEKTLQKEYLESTNERYSNVENDARTFHNL